MDERALRILTIEYQRYFNTLTEKEQDHVRSIDPKATFVIGKHGQLLLRLTNEETGAFFEQYTNLHWNDVYEEIKPVSRLVTFINSL